jgi:hypothetical protein
VHSQSSGRCVTSRIWGGEHVRRTREKKVVGETYVGEVVGRADRHAEDSHGSGDGVRRRQAKQELDGSEGGSAPATARHSPSRRSG